MRQIVASPILSSVNIYSSFGFKRNLNILLFFYLTNFLPFMIYTLFFAALTIC